MRRESKQLWPWFLVAAFVAMLAVALLQPPVRFDVTCQRCRIQREAAEAMNAAVREWAERGRAAREAQEAQDADPDVIAAREAAARVALDRHMSAPWQPQAVRDQWARYRPER
jgi:hypothetical protein